jgi:hypothetical protein
VRHEVAALHLLLLAMTALRRDRSILALSRCTRGCGSPAGTIMAIDVGSHNRGREVTHVRVSEAAAGVI